MSKSETKILNFLNIYPGEGYKVYFLITNSFFSGMIIAFFYTAAAALFLEKFKHNYTVFLPVAYMASAVLGYTTSFFYRKLEQKYRFNKLPVVSFAWLTVFTGILSYGAYHFSDTAVFAFFLFIWFRVIQLLTNVQFWGMAGRILNLQQGKRLFGLVNAGGVISGIASSFSIPLLLKSMDVTDLFFLCTAIFLLWLMFLTKELRHFQAELGESPAPRPTTTKPPPLTSRIRLLENRYTIFTSVLAILPLFALYYIDYLFLGMTRAKFAEDTAAFIALFFGVVKIVDLLVKFFISGKLITRYGLRNGLLLLPVVLLGTLLLAAVAGFNPKLALLLFPLIVMSKLFDRSFRTSINDPAFQILLQPLPAETRPAIQSRIEGIAKQLGIGLVGLTLVLFGLWQVIQELQIILILLVLIGIWIGVTVLVYREYRKSLQQTLVTDTTTTAETNRSLSVIEQFQQQIPKFDFPEFEWYPPILARMEPFQYDQLLQKLLRHPEPEKRQYALQHIEIFAQEKARTWLSRFEAKETDTELIKIAKGKLQLLEKTLKIDPTLEELERMSRSSRLAQRIDAIRWLAQSNDAKSQRLLTELMHDHHPRVRNQAMKTCVQIRRGGSVFIALLIESLASPQNWYAAAAVLIQMGEKLLPHLEMFFNKMSDEPFVLQRILYIYHRIGTPRVQTLLWEKINFPDPRIENQILRSLSLQNFRVPEDDHIIIQLKMEETIANFAWAIAALLDIQRSRLGQPLRPILEQSIEDFRRRIFWLLALISDAAAVALVGDKILEGKPNERIFALELLDMLLSSELKARLAPVFEDIALSQRLKRLQTEYPQPRLKPLARIKDIVNQDPRKANRWLKALALQRLGALRSCEVPAELKAQLFSADLLLQETAARGIYQMDPAVFRHQISLLSPKAQLRLNRLFPADNNKITQYHFTIEKVIFLKGIESLKPISEDRLVDLALSISPSHLPARHPLIQTGDALEKIYIIISGKVQVQYDDKRTTEVTSGDWVGDVRILTEENFNFSAVTLEKVTLFSLKRDRFFAFLADGMLLAGEQLF